MHNKHPSTFFSQKNLDVIRDAAAKAEKDGKLTRAQLNTIHEQNWFRALMPAAYGGLQMPLADAMQLFESLSWADGSVGWVVSHCAYMGRMSAFVEGGNKFFKGDKLCVTGSEALTGTAHKTKGGYKIEGFWQYAPYTTDATTYVVNCILSENGIPQKDEKNVLKILSLFLQKNEVDILPTWNAMGLIASASNDFEIKEILVTEDRAFIADNTAPKIDAPLFRYPNQQLGEAAMASNISGMTIHFLDLCESLFVATKGRSGTSLMGDGVIQDMFTKNTQKFYDARTKLFYAIELTWQASVNNLPIKPAILYKVSSGAYELAKRARECVDSLYPYCGLQAADKASEINRVWRDLHTATQHGLLAFGSLPE
jgi:alkylation response protein AidB-like acyl-CoA dehydrogenase